MGWCGDGKPERASGRQGAPIWDRDRLDEGAEPQYWWALSEEGERVGSRGSRKSGFHRAQSLSGATHSRHEDSAFLGREELVECLQGQWREACGAGPAACGTEPRDHRLCRELAPEQDGSSPLRSRKQLSAAGEGGPDPAVQVGAQELRETGSSCSCFPAPSRLGCSPPAPRRHRG